MYESHRRYDLMSLDEVQISEQAEPAPTKFVSTFTFSAVYSASISNLEMNQRSPDQRVI